MYLLINHNYKDCGVCGKVKIGYPCINTEIGCSTNKTFRLRSYSEERFINTVGENLNCLERILLYNLEKELFFFRIGSDLIPFASHPVCTINWVELFREQFERLGDFIKKHGLRISMHPDQFILLNSPHHKVVDNSIGELDYHASFFDALGADFSAKIQIHVGGVYGDKKTAMKRFIKRFEKLPDSVRRRLVIENDDRLYSIEDCKRIHEEVGIPIIFDYFHHECLGDGRPPVEILEVVDKTWKRSDGVPIVDYSSQAPGEKKGKHAESLAASAPLAYPVKNPGYVAFFKCLPVYFPSL
jgi:UV DNA damage endonuclease